MKLSALLYVAIALDIAAVVLLAFSVGLIHIPDIDQDKEPKEPLGVCCEGVPGPPPMEPKPVHYGDPILAAASSGLALGAIVAVYHSRAGHGRDPVDSDGGPAGRQGLRDDTHSKAEAMEAPTIPMRGE